MNNVKVKSQAEPFGQSAILIEIESLVKTIVEHSGLYRPAWDVYQRRSHCAVIVRNLPHLLAFYVPTHEFSEHIEAFWHACEKMGLLSCGKPTWMADDLRRISTDRVKVAESLAELILEYTQTQDFKRKAADRVYEQRLKRERLEAYSRSVLAKYARTLALRVDLGYLKISTVDIAEVYRHLDALMDLIRRRSGVFKDMVGYVLCVEQGETKGYHLHLAIYLPGHMHQRDGYLAIEIGRLWVGITEGAGGFHSCNARKDKYERMGLRGVGMIHRDDDHEYENAVSTVGYLAKPEKDDQYLRMKPEGRRTYFTGLAPY